VGKESSEGGGVQKTAQNLGQNKDGHERKKKSKLPQGTLTEKRKEKETEVGKN